jgi:hypothetical protein
MKSAVDKACNNTISRAAFLLFLSCGLLACGGQKLNRKPLTDLESAPLLTVTDDHLKVTLVDVLVSNDPTSWVKNARWDEYIIAIAPLDHARLKIQAITLLDSFGQKHDPQYQRRSLNRAFKRIKKNHQQQGIEVTIGHQAGRGLATLAASSSAGALAASTSSSAYLSGAVSAGAGAVVVTVPALAVTAVLRMVNHHKVQQVLNQKAINLPATVNSKDQPWSIIYPAIPAPQAMQIKYLNDDQPHALQIDLTQGLADLHISSPSG